jgi:hypothetical protein
MSIDDSSGSNYMFVSVDQLVEKYVQRRYDEGEVRNGWHGWRATLRREKISLPLASQLRHTISDDSLDASNPRTTHYLADHWQSLQSTA